VHSIAQVTFAGWRRSSWQDCDGSSAQDGAGQVGRIAQVNCAEFRLYLPTWSLVMLLARAGNAAVLMS
jgi:hypothetical protein